MNDRQLMRRARIARILAVGVVVALATAGVLMAGGRPAAAGAAAAGQSVLTLRTERQHDALWLVSPSDGTATSAGMLPGLAESAAVSPDGGTVAYQPNGGKPFIWLGYGALASKTISLQTAGIKILDGMTWIGADKLLVSGWKTTHNRDASTAGLFTVDVTTGSIAAFHSPHGIEPSADAATGKVAYVRFTKLDNGTDHNGHAPLYRESLMLTTVSGSGAGRTLESVEYRTFADQRAFAGPQLSPGAHWIMAARTGSDVEVTYTLYNITDYAMLWLTLWAPAPPASAWAPDGDTVAFGGAGLSADSSAGSCVYVANATAGALARTSAGLLAGVSAGWVIDLAWADDGMLVADALDTDTGAANPHVLLLHGDDLSTVKDLGEGHLSVWVK